MSVEEERKVRPYGSDPIIEEVWRIREEHAKQFNTMSKRYATAFMSGKK